MMYAPAPHHPRRRSRKRRARAPTSLGVGGGIALSVGALFGFWTADQLHRMSVTYATTDANAPGPGKATTLPAGVNSLAQYNNAAVLARPTWQSQAWQWGTAIFAGMLGLFVPWRMLKLFLYGTSLGTGLHATYQLVNGYIMMPLIQGGTTADAWGQRAYGTELEANWVMGKMTKPNGVPASSMFQGLLGAPPRGGRALPANGAARVPVSLATRPGALGGSPFPHGTPAALGADAMPGGYTGQPGNPGPASFPAGWALKPVTGPGDCPPGGKYMDLGADGKWCAVPPPATPPAPPTGGPTPPPAPPTMTPPQPPPAPPMAPPTATPSPPVPACPLPFMGSEMQQQRSFCCGTNPCSCGANQGPPGTVLGQPPSHPLFAMMFAPRRAA